MVWVAPRVRTARRGLMLCAAIWFRLPNPRGSTMPRSVHGPKRRCLFYPGIIGRRHGKLHPVRMEKSRRRDLVRDYKEIKSRPGVYSLTCAATGETWVGNSRAIDTQVNNIMFSLRHGSHRNRALQAA